MSGNKADNRRFEKPEGTHMRFDNIRMTWAIGLIATMVLAPRALADKESKPAPVTIEKGAATLSPTNTSIGFVATHVGEEPKPRLGGFGKFTGEAKIDESGELAEVTFSIDTTSVWTQIAGLTKHLKTPDFLNISNHPMASFKSTSIKKKKNGKGYTINGEFTFLEVTKELSIPAEITVNDNGLVLTSSFPIDRTDFGMEFGQAKVTNAVNITVIIGQETKVGG